MAAATSAAPSPEQFELARKFAMLTDQSDVLLNVIRAGYQQSASESLVEIEDDAERAAAQARADKMLTRLEPKLRELLPKFTDASARVFAREFSADELRQMIAFAESPAGKHYSARLPMLATSPELIQAQQDLTDGLTPILDDFRKEACAAKAAQRLAAGDKKAICPLSQDAEVKSS